MFANHNYTVELDGYDFSKHENALRWRGLFTPYLKKVLEQVHPRMEAQEEALQYVETLCLRTLALLCEKPLPHSIQDIEEKVKRSFPAPIDYWALNEAKETINSKKRKPVLPVERVHSLLQKDVLQYKIDSSVTVFILAVLEYISADILKLAGNYVRKIKHSEITREDIEVAMCADKVLMDMFYQKYEKNKALPSPLPTFQTQRSHTTYEEVVKELILDEKQYQRDLHMIIRVFREELLKIVADSKDLEPIFSNIFDIYEVTMTLLSSLEDVIEISQEQSTPCVGSCFEELAEAEEFHVYTKYAQDISSFQSREALNTVLSKPNALSLLSAGNGFRDAVKYYLPKLLFVPLWHAFVYFDYIKLLMGLSPLQDDIESFKQVLGLLRPLRCDLENIVTNLPNQVEIPLSSRLRRQLAMERTRELQHTVEHWDKDVGQNCNEFIREGSLGKIGPGKRVAERKVFLFDSLMVLCKPTIKKPAVASGGISYDYRLKEKFVMRRVEIHDRDDTDEIKASFEISPRVQPAVILTAKNSRHKQDWMADLIMVNTKPMLDRILDSILIDIEKHHPLRLPSPEMYKFAVPDSPDNIVLEDKESVGVPLIKGATLCKLIERLTYHIYADPMFVRTFLTTYRYFCSPLNLLNLLIERFSIPEPNLVYNENHHTCDRNSTNSESEKINKSSQREDWKRYRKEYVQPVQFRVLNVLRHWVDHHFYDFEKEPFLLKKLLLFLENINGKSMRKWVDSVLKIVQRKNEQEKCNKLITFAYGHSPPPIEYHLNTSERETNLLTLHPLELARQLTLLEFALYKNVKPSELVGSPWTKKDKYSKSPNLLKIMKHTTNVTRWIEKSIIESENYEERVAMVTRAIEVMMVMLELNNFNGILSISAAMGSASVYRLKLTFQGLPARYEKFLEECRELSDGHLKKYQEKLRSINPPCVPFFGRYLTNILHLEEGNPDFLSNTKLINFSKRRRVSEIIGEIQQYQNQPYCLMVDPKIRDFLENLDPFKGLSDTDISNFLYHESLRIEPRGCKQAPKFPRKWPSVTLKSPGIKPRRQNNSNISLGTKSLNQLQYDGEQSPPGVCASNSRNVSPNTQIYSIFANVNIPERTKSTWQHSQATMEHRSLPSSSIFINAGKQFVYDRENISEPTVSKKDILAISNVNCLSDQITNYKDSSPFQSDILSITSENIERNNNNFASIRNSSHDCSHNSNTQSMKLLHEYRSLEQFPFWSPEHFIKPNYDVDSIICIPENILDQIICSQSHVSNINAFSQHVNVSENTSFVPPLPPRRKDQMDIFEDLAQKKKNHHSLTLPPRDDEISPPPIPPRIKTSISLCSRSSKNEVVGNNSLLPPNTSSIMIRRKSAIDRNFISFTTSESTTAKVPTYFETVPLNNSIKLEDLAISPVLSSSTTTTPNTPLTPNSPNIPAECSVSDLSYVSRLKPASFEHHVFASGTLQWESHKELCCVSDCSSQPTIKPCRSVKFVENKEEESMFFYPSTNQE